MITTCDMCAYVFQAKGEQGEALAQKRTQIMTSSSEVCKRISRQCCGQNSKGEFKAASRGNIGTQT